MFDLEMRNSSKYTKYLKNSIHIHKPIRKKLFVRFAHLEKNKFKYNFQGTVVLLCKCGNETESKVHFLILCVNFTIERQTLMNKTLSLAVFILKRIIRLD